MMARPFAPRHGLPKGPEHLWREMRRQSADGFTLSSLWGASNSVAKRTIKGYLVAYEALGVIRRIGQRPTIAGRSMIVWSLADDAPRVAPVIRRPDYRAERGVARRQLWGAMRSMGAFDVFDLAHTASTEECAVKPRTAERYVRELARAGLLVCLTPYAKGAHGRPGARAATWKLKPAANTGPLPPKVIRGDVYDPNRDVMIAARPKGAAA